MVILMDSNYESLFMNQHSEDDQIGKLAPTVIFCPQIKSKKSSSFSFHMSKQTQPVRALYE